MTVMLRSITTAAAMAFPGMAWAVQVEPVKVPNEHRIFFGEIGTLSAGAVAARVNDPSAVWYNPGRVAYGSSPSIAGNATVYESVTTTFDTSDGTVEQAVINPVPGYVGSSGAVPWTEGAWKWGFGVFMPVAWNSSLENRNTIPVTYGNPNPGIYELHTIGRVSAETSEIVPAIAVGRRIGDHAGVGISLMVPYYQNRTEKNTSEVSTTRGYYRSYWEIQEQTVASVRLGAGGYLSLDGWDLGFAVKTANWRIMSESTAEMHAVSSSLASGNTSTYDAYIGDGEAQDKSPWEVTVAAARRWHAVTIEADVTYLSSVSEYSTVEGDLPIERRLFNPVTGNDLPQSSIGTPGTVRLTDDVNVAVGVAWHVSDTISLHGGWAVDKNQVADTNEFAALTIQSVTAGMLYKTPQTAMFAGGYHQWSDEAPVRVFNTSASRFETADASISGWGVVLGASYYLP
ncbi:MAG: hypothetical protein RLZZ127_1686 [Planctomycetota bacterium]